MSTPDDDTQPHRRPGKRRKPQARLDQSAVCFDCETTNHGELLELSVHDLQGNEVYHSYYKPRARTWPTDIHHITPAMVSDSHKFAKSRRQVARLVCTPRYLIGCALSNDLGILRRHGVTFPGNQTIIDIQRLHWLVNDTSGRKEYNQTGLSAIAAHYGLGFGEGHAHSASADTRLTLECFNALVRDFDRTYPHGEALPQVLEARHLGDLVKRIDTCMQDAMIQYRMNNAGAYVSLKMRSLADGTLHHTLKFGKTRPEPDDTLVCVIKVQDRVQAERDLRRLFAPRQIKGYTGFYDLDAADIDAFMAYTNSIDTATYLQHRRERTKELEVMRRQQRLAAVRKAAKAAQQLTPGQPEPAANTTAKPSKPRKQRKNRARGTRLRDAKPMDAK